MILPRHRYLPYLLLITLLTACFAVSTGERVEGVGLGLAVNRGAESAGWDAGLRRAGLGFCGGAAARKRGDESADGWRSADGWEDFEAVVEDTGGGGAEVDGGVGLGAAGWLAAAGLGWGCEGACLDLD
ncbi:MAG TPA: hypothetical protein VIO61_07440 [Anaerolineaceae bacterium]